MTRRSLLYPADVAGSADLGGPVSDAAASRPIAPSRAAMQDHIRAASMTHACDTRPGKAPGTPEEAHNTIRAQPKAFQPVSHLIAAPVPGSKYFIRAAAPP